MRLTDKKFLALWVVSGKVKLPYSQVCEWFEKSQPVSNVQLYRTLELMGYRWDDRSCQWYEYSPVWLREYIQKMTVYEQPADVVGSSIDEQGQGSQGGQIIELDYDGGGQGSSSSLK